jgi:predicted RNase H-like HicB family nuclease
MNTILIELPVTPIYVEDKKIGGYTIYFKEFPDIIAEGKSKEEALQNLKNTIFDVYKYKNTLSE